MKISYRLLCVALALAPAMGLADNAPQNSTTPGTLAKSTVGLAQDTAITTYIYAKMASHPDLANSNLDISTNQGKVTLNGIVNSQAQVNEVKQMAQDTTGVKSVDSSKLIINQTDSTITIKAPANPPTSQVTVVNDKTATQAEIPVGAADPLLTNKPEPAANIGAQTVAQNETTPALMPLDEEKPANKPVHHIKLKHHAAAKSHHHKNLALKHHSTHKKLAAAKHHHKIVAHKKTHQRVAMKKHAPTKHLAQAKKISHDSKPDTKQVAAKATPAKKQVVAQNTKHSNESVHDMTNDYLKSALMENKPIPEE